MALTTTSEILERLKQEIRDELSTATTDTRLLARLNEAYVDIVSGGSNLNDSIRGIQAPKPFIFPWAVAEDPIKFVTEKPILDLTAEVVQGSSSAILSSTVSKSLVGWFLRLDSDREVYKVLAHEAGTAILVLDLTYVNNNEPASGCEIFKLDYELGNDLLMPTNGLITYFQDGPIPLIDRRQFEKKDILRRAKRGLPSMACIIKNKGADKSVVIRLNSYPEEPERLELPYIAFPASLDLVGSNPILSPNDNQLLVDYAAALEYDLRDDTIADRYMRRALDRFKAMRSVARQFTEFQDANFAKIIGWSNYPSSLKGGYYGSHPRNS